MERRDMLKVMATLPLGTWALDADGVAAASTRAADVLNAAQATGAQPDAFTPVFFNALEWRTVRVLADIVIPRDARSGSATEAGVPEFMDFIMNEYPGGRARMRNGLGWLNAQSRARFGVPFPDAKDTDRVALVEYIAWPRHAKPEHRDGVLFFNAFRDLTATGFFTSRMGIEDLGYIGNVPNFGWQGCPPEVLAHFGIRD
jgi:hypothetical protein